MIGFLFMVSIARFVANCMEDDFVMYGAFDFGSTVLRARSRSKDGPFASYGVWCEASAVFRLTNFVAVSVGRLNASTGERRPIAPRQINRRLVFILGLGFFRFNCDGLLDEDCDDGTNGYRRR